MDEGLQSFRPVPLRGRTASLQIYLNVAALQGRRPCGHYRSGSIPEIKARETYARTTSNSGNCPQHMRLPHRHAGAIRHLSARPPLAGGQWKFRHEGFANDPNVAPFVDEIYAYLRGRTDGVIGRGAGSVTIIRPCRPLRGESAPSRRSARIAQVRAA